MSSEVAPARRDGETPATNRICAVISDFGGVLTSPLLDAFNAFQESSGVPLEELGKAMMAIMGRSGTNPLVELETGRLSEAQFLADLGDQLTAQLGRKIEMHGFGEAYFDALEPNPKMIEYMRTLRGRGLRMAICTNNVREWEATWRAMLPVDEIFDVVVDSGFVGIRKPDPQIYQITLERLDVAPESALFVDDIEINCKAAQELGMTAVHFKSNDQAIADIETALRTRVDA